MGDSNLFGAKAPAKAHLVRGTGGLSGEINDLRADVDEAFEALENGGGQIQTDEFTNVPAGATDAIKTAAASAATPQIFDAADLDGVVGNAEMDPPRNIDITTSVHADIDAVAVTITGRVRDRTGALVAQTEDITLTDGGGATDAGAKMFSIVDQVAIPPQSGPGGTVEIGHGPIIGVSQPMKSRAGLLAPLREIEAGSVVTTGTFVAKTIAEPHGSYLPATPPNGTNDYSLTYEVDPA
jgi:hypothetical protein